MERRRRGTLAAWALHACSLALILAPGCGPDSGAGPDFGDAAVAAGGATGGASAGGVEAGGSVARDSGGVPGTGGSSGGMPSSGGSGGTAAGGAMATGGAPGTGGVSTALRCTKNQDCPQGFACYTGLSMPPANGYCAHRLSAPCSATSGGGCPCLDIAIKDDHGCEGILGGYCTGTDDPASAWYCKAL